MAYYRCVGGNGTSVLVEKTITENGVYDPTDDNANGYSLITVNNPVKTAGNYRLYEDNNFCLIDQYCTNYFVTTTASLFPNN